MSDNLSKGTYSFGPFRLCLAERRLKRDRVAVEIGSRALDILIALIEGSGEIVSNQTLIEKAWPNTLRRRVQFARPHGDAAQGTRG
jgi:DNA-binding winged helix-turn-helix (wHTH) protein